MKKDTTSTLPKAPHHIPNAPAGHMYHARIYPGEMTPKGMGSCYDGGKMVAKMPNNFTKGQPMYEHSKDPQLIRTTGGGAYGM